jgi:hypothetical protein
MVLTTIKGVNGTGIKRNNNTPIKLSAKNRITSRLIHRKMIPIIIIIDKKKAPLGA